MNDAALLGRRSLLAGALALPLLSVAGGCSQGPEAIAPTGEPKLLNLYCWDTYIDSAVLEDFTRLSGIKIAMTVMPSNAALMAMMAEGNREGFDVITPSSNYVARLALTESLLPLQSERLPNRGNIDTPFVDVGYDPGRLYSMPLTWFALGIGYDKRRLAKPPKSWKAILDSDQFKGRIALPEEAGDVFRIYAKYLGKSINQLKPEDISTIEAMLKRQKPNLRPFHQDDGQDMLARGELDLVVEFNGDMAQMMRTNPHVGFVVPNEGTLLNVDNLSIPVGARHPGNAHAFINFLMSADIGKRLASSRLYPTCNGAAKAMMGPDYLENEVLYLPAEPLARSEFAFLDQALDEQIDAAFARVLKG